MRWFAVAFVMLAAATAAPAAEPDPHARSCGTSQYGDLGRGWQARAVVAGRVAFVGMRDGYGDAFNRRPPDQGKPFKVVVVVDPTAIATVTIAPRSRGFAALGYNDVRGRGGGDIPLADGTVSVRFHGCRAEPSRAPWNRGTQFGGYFLVRRPGCVVVDVGVALEPVVRRTLRFGVPRCGA